MKLSVGLPTFKADKIAWLSMEGLCNQVGIDFTWELIICEELYFENEAQYCGEKFFMSYQDRLHKVGCRKIKFIDLEHYVTLESKWKFIVQAASKRSKMLILQASDNYSPNDRLSSAYGLMKRGADWIHYKKVYFYNCKTEKIILRNAGNYEYSKGVNIGIRLELIKNLPFRDRGRSVDSWLYDITKENKRYLKEMWDEGDWETGVCTDGFNRVSYDRIKHYKNPQPPFYKTDKQIQDILPPYIVSRLLELK
jgi:hypothetical protein